MQRLSEAMDAPGFPYPPPSARGGLDRLGEIDLDLAQIERQAGPLPWRVRPPGFAGLLQIVMAQQISSRAAAAIWGRLAAIPGALTPLGLRCTGDVALRQAGLSRAKVLAARALADAFADGTLDAARISALDDAAAVAAIGAVRGLGVWTAEVYLLFALERPDVFPAGDLALAAGAAHLKSLPGRPSPAALRALAEPWRPYRGLAARLLWHHWRYVTGRPVTDESALPVAANP